jgi:peptide/nickel transport system substrate-binding protein
VLGCGGGDRSTTAPAVSEVRQPKRGGVLSHISSNSGIWTRGLDPHVVPTTEGGRMGLFYQALMRDNSRAGAVEGQIAQRWEQPSPTEYTFTLTPGVRWHDKPPANGRALTADDVVFSINRVRTGEPRFVHRSLLNSVDKVEAVGSTSVRVTTKQPDASTLPALAALPMLIMAPEVVEKAAGKFATVDTAVGTGPFILQAMDDVSATLVRNPDYWKPGLPYMDGVRLVYMAAELAQLAAFVAGQLDATYLGGSEAKRLVAEQSNNYRLQWFPDLSLHGMYANTQKPPFSDARLTKALRLLVDHTEMVSGWADVWFGKGRLASAFPAALSDWDFTEDEYRKFPEWMQPKDEAARQAMSLLNAAGYTKDNPLTFLVIAANSDYIVALLQLLQAQWKRHSQGIVDAQIRPLDVATRDTFVNRGDFEYLVHGMVPALRDPDSSLRYIYYTNGSRNYGKYSDAALDQMIDHQRTLFDIPKRKAAVRDVLGHLMNNAPYVTSAAFYRLDAAQLRVQDRVPEGESSFLGGQYDQVWLDV